MRYVFSLCLCTAAVSAYGGITIDGTTITFDDASAQSTAASGGGGGSGPADHGGTGSVVNGTSSFVGGGDGNQVTDAYGTIAGGHNNNAGDNNGTTADKPYTTVSGGYDNTASETAATIAGGMVNTASGVGSTVSGGTFNDANGAYAAVAGGTSSVASADYSFAAGRRAKATHAGAYVWGDGTNDDVASSTADEFTARAAGGVRFFTNTALTSGAVLTAGSSTWAGVSSKAAKENYEALDAEAILRTLATLPIERWNYTHQDDSIKHIGPYAEDFWQAFGLDGAYSGRITTQDLDGVALAAIQGLNARLEEKETEISQLRQLTEALETRLEQLERHLSNEINPTQN